MNCPLCANWGPDANCGHCLVDGVQAPAGYLHRGLEPIGCRAWGHIVNENSGRGHAVSHIICLATAAAAPEWRRL